jgi:hypothetical protein
MSSIFLSHAHQDKPFARKLAASLRLAGHYVWIDEAEINIGDSLVQKIREGIDQVDFVAAILSSHSITSTWVTKELDLASNREMKEKKVIVLPLLIEKVELPLFLEGKLYGDFIYESEYENTLSKLLKTLGTVNTHKVDKNEINYLKEQVREALKIAEQHHTALKAHQRIALREKSASLRLEIESANKQFPLHAPINISYAFEVMGKAVTLDYLLWTIGKATHRGTHSLEMMLTLDDKWSEVESMLQAYSDLLNAAVEEV